MGRTAFSEGEANLLAVAPCETTYYQLLHDGYFRHQSSRREVAGHQITGKTDQQSSDLHTRRIPRKRRARLSMATWHTARP